MNTRHDHPGQTRWTDDLAEKGAGLIISAFPQANLNPHVARIAARCVMDLVDSGDHEMQGGVTAAAIENETQACPDPDAHWRLDEALERAEKAEGESDTYKKLHRASLRALEEVEQERDAAREEAATLWGRLRDAEWERDAVAEESKARADSIRAQQKMVDHLRAEQPRTLTADDVTDTMVERGFKQLAQMDNGGISLRSTWAARQVLEAALTGPAEDPEVLAIADVLGDFAIADEHSGDRDDIVLARRLHERGIRKTEDSEDR